MDGNTFSFSGDSGTVTADWKIDSNVPTIDVNDWHLVGDFGTKERVSVKLWMTNQGWRSILLGYDSGFLKHSTFDVDFSYDAVSSNVSGLDAFYGGHTRYAISMTSGAVFNADQPAGASHDGDVMCVRINCQTPSTVHNSYIWMNVRVSPVDHRYYHEQT